MTDFEFQVFAWHCDDGQSYPLAYDDKDRFRIPAEHIETFQFNVHMFGKTMDGKSVCIHVHDFEPTFYLHIPDREMDYGRYEDIRSWIMSLLRAKTEEVDERQRHRWMDFDDHLVDENARSGIKVGTTLWGFTNFRKDKYYKFSFKSLWAYEKALMKFKSMIYDRSKIGDDVSLLGEHFQLFDVIDPLIRFAHTKDLCTAGWIRIAKRYLQKVEYNMSDCDHEYTVSYDHVHPIQREQVCPRLLEMAFDIEVDSHDEKFPKPEEPRNVVFQIGITLKHYISKEIDERILLHFGAKIVEPLEGVTLKQFSSEKDLLLAFSSIVRKRSPDLIYSWNGDDFDWNYIFVRAEVNGIMDQFQLMSRIQNYPCVVDILDFSSSAMGQNKYKHVRIPGRLNLDILTFTKKDAVNKYDNYKLDTVAAKVLGERKDDVYYKDIFRWYKEQNPAKLATIGRYCVQDTVLVQKLVDQTDVVVQLFEMANITYTQVSDLLIRGQQIKVYSQITKAAMDKGFMTPFFSKPSSGEPKGAIVLEPKVGVYKSPVACLDFASLYPTIMMAYNMCYSTLVLDERYANVPGVVYDNIEWEEDGQKVRVRFAQKVTSVIPELQRSMMTARKAVKKMKRDLTKTVVDPKTGKKVDICTDELRSRVLTGRELAIKVSMNSIYGFTSAFKLRLTALTGAVTAQGRRMIYQTKDFMEKVFPDLCVANGWTTERPRLEAIGGDSVTGDTPILCKLADGTIDYKPIDELIAGPWIKRSDGKEYGTVTCQIWTDQGFTNVKHIIRHFTNKKMYRVNTSSGIVDVTEDHSLLDPKSNRVKPTEVTVGQSLLHSSLPKSDIFNDTTDQELAWAMGLFFADGSCGSYHCPSGNKSSWAINNQNKLLLHRAKMALEKEYTELEFNILETMQSSRVYKLVPLSQGAYGGICRLVKNWRSMFYTTSSREKKVPVTILNANLDTKSSFLSGYYAGNGYYSDKSKRALSCSTKGKISAAGLTYLFDQVGYHVTIGWRKDKPNIFRLRSYSKFSRHDHQLSTKKEGQVMQYPQNRIPLDAIRSLEAITTTDQYVYDLETANHHFGVGPGRLVVHNTDSVFIHFPGFTIMDTIRLATHAEKLLTNEVFNREPIAMEYEKVYLPYILIKKKNYIGKKFENDDVKWKLDFKGIALKRRNYCPLLKEIYQKVIDVVMEDVNHGPDLAVDIIRTGLEKLESGSVSYDELVITASLKSFESYKNANLPHVQLAQRMEERDEAVSVGDRLSYVVIADFTKSTDLSARSEEVLYAKERQLPIDKLFYINQQLRKPLTAFMTILGKKDATEAVFSQSEVLIRRKQDHLVQKGYRARNNLQDISTFFVKKSDNSSAQQVERLPPASRFAKGKGKGKGKSTVTQSGTLDTYFKK